jgi:hypothetical protein
MYQHQASILASWKQDVRDKSHFGDLQSGCAVVGPTLPTSDLGQTMLGREFIVRGDSVYLLPVGCRMPHLGNGSVRSGRWSGCIPAVGLRELSVNIFPIDAILPVVDF